MPSTTWRSPTVATQSQIDGTSFAWTSLSNIYADDGSVVSGFSSADPFIIRVAKLLIAGSPAGSNLASNNSVGFGTVQSYGSTSNLWGLTPTAAQVNASGFGFDVCYGYDNGTPTSFAQNIFVSGFGFSAEIPSNAVITGIEVEIDDDQINLGGGLSRVTIDHIRMRVTYSFTAQVSAQGHSQGSIYRPLRSGAPKQKRFRHRVYDPDTHQYIGEWLDVEPDPNFKQVINNPVANMQLEFARTDATVSKVLDTLELEQNTELLTDESDTILAIDTVSPKGLGAGTDLELNLDYKLTAYYGEFVELATEAGEVMTTESFERLMVNDGRPEGKDMFTGYVSRWEANFNNGKNNLAANILSHSQELNNIIYETDDTAVVSNITQSGVVEYGLVALGKNQPADRTGLGQSFTAVAADNISRYSVWAKRIGTSNDTYFPSLTMTFVTLAPDGGGVTIYTVTKQITSLDYAEYIFELPEAYLLTNAAVYSLVLTTDAPKTGGVDSPYMVYVRANTSVYAGGGAYESTNGGSYTSIANVDLNFQAWEAGGATTVTLNSMSPEAMLKKVIDFAASRGARVRYTSDSIDATGVIASYTFNTNTIKEAIDKILELAPKDWYYYYDVAANIIHMHKRPSVATHTLTLRKDISELKLIRTIEKLVNDVYYSGGGTPAVFTRVTDGPLIAKWRRGLGKVNDTRVTLLATAQLLAQAEIDRYGDAIYSGNGTIHPTDFYIEDMTVGELLAFTGFDSFVDALELQLVDYTYKGDLLDFVIETLLPKTQQRIEELRRDLEVQEQRNNPTSPS